MVDSFVLARQRMVEDLKKRGISDARVLRVMSEVPRELFVPGNEYLAYHDMPLPIGRGQTISQPYIVALMLSLLELTGHEKVLDVGTGSGYLAALLGRLARKVISLEIDPVLAERAKAVLKKLRVNNVSVLVGDGVKGYLYSAPFDAIVVSAAVPKVPESLLDQLAVNGSLVIPVGSRITQNLMRYRKFPDGSVSEESFGLCRFVPLQGAWD